MSDFDAKDMEMASVGLPAHIKEHFKPEESSMRRVKYPGLRSHTKKHLCLIEAIEEFCQALASNPARVKGDDDGKLHLP